MADDKKRFPVIKFIKACVEFIIVIIKLFHIDNDDDEKKVEKIE